MLEIALICFLVELREEKLEEENELIACLQDVTGKIDHVYMHSCFKKSTSLLSGVLVKLVVQEERHQSHQS